MIRVPRWKEKKIDARSVRSNLAEVLDRAQAGVRWDVRRRGQPYAGIVSGLDARCLVALERVSPSALGRKMERAHRDERNAINAVLNWIEDHQEFAVEDASIVDFRANLADCMKDVRRGTRYEVTRHGVSIVAVVPAEDLRCLANLRRIDPDRFARCIVKAGREDRIALGVVLGWLEAQERDEGIEETWIGRSEEANDDDD